MFRRIQVNFINLRNIFIVLSMILTLFLVSGCQYYQVQNNCIKLSNNFNIKIVNVSIEECDSLGVDDHIWVGAKLIHIDQNYQGEAFDRNMFTLTFKTPEKESNIYIATKNDSIPYEVDKFYKFDLKNRCALIRSAASSGMFYDPELNNFEHISKCD